VGRVRLTPLVLGALLAATGLVASLPAGAAPPKPASGAKLTKQQIACAKRTIGVAAAAKLVRGTLRPTAKQKAKLAPCLKTKPPSTTPEPSKPAPAAPGEWLTAAPFDLSLVQELSRFRSCTGHDFSGYDIEGELESARSMKHYVTFSLPWTPAGSAKLYAPFDGTVVIVGTGGKPGSAVYIESDAGKPWQFFFAHVDPLVRVGDRVRAGDPVAAVPPADALDIAYRLRPSVAFDTGLHSVKNGGPAYESYFLHMTKAVLQQFAARGFTPDKLIVPKATRDAAPCTEYNRSDATDYVQASG